jgi:hypothetical protein
LKLHPEEKQNAFQKSAEFLDALSPDLSLESIVSKTLILRLISLPIINN